MQRKPRGLVSFALLVALIVGTVGALVAARPLIEHGVIVGLAAGCVVLTAWVALGLVVLSTSKEN